MTTAIALLIAILELDHYAEFLQQHGHYREAEPIYLRSTGLALAIHGPNSRPYALGLMHLGSLYHSELKLDLAESTTRRAAAILVELDGPDGLDCAYANANLATILAAQGENARAEPVLRRAIYLIENHGQHAPALQVNLGLIYLRQGEFRKAEPLLQAALANSNDDLGRAHALAALAELAVAERRWSEADDQIQQAYQLTIALEGEDYSRLAGILHLRGVVETHSGDSSSAVADLKQALGFLETLAGSDSPSLLPVLSDYATALHKAKRKTEAKLVLQRARQIHRSFPKGTRHENYR